MDKHSQDKHSEDIMTVPVLPVKGGVLFPYFKSPFVINRPESVAALNAALSDGEKHVAVFAQKNPDTVNPTQTDLYPVGTLAEIDKLVHINNQIRLIITGLRRVKLLGLPLEQPYLNGRIEVLEEPQDWNDEVEARYRAVLDLAGKILELLEPNMRMSLSAMMSEDDNPMRQIYLLASLLSLSVEQEMSLLMASSRAELFELLHSYMTHEYRVLEIRDKIARNVMNELDKEQKEILLRKQMRAIQHELGDQNPEQVDAMELLQGIQNADLPEEIRKELLQEYARLERMSAMSAEYQLKRSYIEFALDLPWRNSSTDNLDLDRAGQILDEDHYGLKDLKQRMLEQLAVMSLNPEAGSPILCFVGAPGVGKTSVGKSIARAMDRRFERISLGGLHDEAELRGHRRTYVGAMPGRILQAIRRTGVNNPLLMLDEVDKLGVDYHGDPAAALMEILDPEQNNSFHDNYLDMPFDLSKVLFITTANTLDGIPKPLLDRMEILRLPGYSSEEKQQIARRYLLPKQLAESGLKRRQLSVSDTALTAIIARYTREAGVRELERAIARIARKTATRVARGESDPVHVDMDDLFDLLGPPRFFQEQSRRILPPGVAAGLAWTEAGGEVLYVEAVLLPDSKNITLTGQLGSVMQESAKAAQSYIWSHADELSVDRTLISNSGIHIHVPVGAVPKDGPSAGVAMIAALYSLYSDNTVRSDIAMTGEITLSGLVMPVGGIREKVLAAHRAGIFHVILPRENEKELLELPRHVLARMTFTKVNNIDEVITATITHYGHKKIMAYTGVYG